MPNNTSNKKRLVVGRGARFAALLPRMTARDIPAINFNFADLPALPSAEAVAAALAERLGPEFLKKNFHPKAVKAREKLGIPPEHLAVLSIDGGGARGLIPLAALIKFEEEYDVKCCEVFNVICGTSTGAIIGAMLASGMPAQEIREFYKAQLHKIFEFKRNGNSSEAYADEWVEDVKQVSDRMIDLYDDTFDQFGGQVGEVLEEITETLSGIDMEAIIEESVISATKKVAEAPAYVTLSAAIDDKTLRVIGGNPVYGKSRIRKLLREYFSKENGCKTLGELAKKNQCILIFSATDRKTGASVFMSATGRQTFQGSCENAAAAACIESSGSAPLYFSPYKGELMDGGTLGWNMPLLGALLHLEKKSQRRIILEVPPHLQIERCKEGKEPIDKEVSDLVFQFFDLHETTIISIGCGVGPVKRWDKHTVDISHKSKYYDNRNWPYGELGHAMQIAGMVPSDLEVGGGVIGGGLAGAGTGAIFGPAGAVVGAIAGAALGLWGATSDFTDEAGDLKRRMKKNLNEGLYFGVGATINTLGFLKDGLGRDSWTVQEDVFRSSLYRGDFRRFQLSLDMGMQTNGLWKFHENYKERRDAADQPRYQMPYRIEFGKTTLAEGRYTLISIWNELSNPPVAVLVREQGLNPEAPDPDKFIPDLAPMGPLSLRWLHCIGDRFADAVTEFGNAKGAPYMGVDLADDDGQDVFVSVRCRNWVTPERWQDLHAVLGG